VVKHALMILHRAWLFGALLCPINGRLEMSAREGNKAFMSKKLESEFELHANG
jgi:hypothetical protein